MVRHEFTCDQHLGGNDVEREWVAPGLFMKCVKTGAAFEVRWFFLFLRGCM